MIRKVFNWVLVLVLPVAWSEPHLVYAESLEERVRILEEKLKARPEKDDEMFVHYDNGLKFGTRDEKFLFQIGGRILVDFAFFDADQNYKTNINDEESGAEFRRARIFLAGLLYDKIKFKAEYDFASTTLLEEPNFKDVYIQLIKLPVVGNFRVGHFKEPWSLERTSSNYITFMERSLPVAFSAGYGLGMGLFNHALKKRATWNAGLFYDTLGEAPPITNSLFRPGAWVGALRLTGLPWYKDKGKKLAHLGFSYAHEDQGQAESLLIRTRPESHLVVVRPVSTGIVAGVTGLDRWLLEGAVVFGSFSLQGEYANLITETGSGMGESNYSSFYVHGSYFITGEHRPYKTESGIFGRVKPKRNFDGKGGWGAWQVAVRYSTIDLNDDGIGAARGGEMDDYTLGLNWHLNSQTRFMFNYVHADVDSAAIPAVPAGKLNIYQFRFQVDF